jgi:hypothetical protein
MIADGHFRWSLPIPIFDPRPLLCGDLDGKRLLILLSPIMPGLLLICLSCGAIFLAPLGIFFAVRARAWGPPPGVTARCAYAPSRELRPSNVWLAGSVYG